MSKLQYNVLFYLMAGGAVFLLFADKLGIPISPTALTGYGAITTYVLTQRSSWTKKDNPGDKKTPTHKAGDGDDPT